MKEACSIQTQTRMNIHMRVPLGLIKTNYIRMKYYFKTLLILLLPMTINAQQNIPDSLRQVLHFSTTDSAKYSINSALGLYYLEDNLDSSLNYTNKCILIARKNNRKINEAGALALKGRAMATLKKYVESFESFKEALKITEDPANENKAWKDNRFTFHQNRLKELGYVHLQIGFHRGFAESADQSVFHFRKALQLGEEVRDTALTGFAYWGLAFYYQSPDKLDSAFILLNKAEQIFRDIGYKSIVRESF